MKKYFIFISFLVFICLFLISCNNDISPPPEDPPIIQTQKLMFSSNRDGDFEIYSLNLDTSILIQLTDNTSTDKQPSLSADGTKITFVSDRSGSWAIYTMDSDGSNVSGVLASLGSSSDGHPNWNPDDSMIAYDDNYDIFTMNADGSGKTNITDTLFDNEFEPSWSPDGTHIAYSYKVSGYYEIYIMQSNGLSRSALTSTATSNEFFPDWSADGTKLTFETNRDGNYEVYRISADGSSPLNITNTSGDESYPAWSSDGVSIAYERGGEIYTRNADATGVETNLTNNAAIDQDPSW